MFALATTGIIGTVLAVVGAGIFAIWTLPLLIQLVVPRWFGLRLDPEGFTARMNLGSRRYQWVDIERFFSSLQALREVDPVALDQSWFALWELLTTTDGGQSGGSTACSSRIVRSALLGGGNPTEVKTFSSSSLDQRLRACSSESHTPTM